MKTYSEKLKDPRWQRKRLEIMQRDGFTCQDCGSNTETLNVHHLQYSSDPWESPDDDLITLCEDCHSSIESAKRQIREMAKNPCGRGVLRSIDKFMKESSGMDRVSTLTLHAVDRKTRAVILLGHDEGEYRAAKKNVRDALSENLKQTNFEA